jgi:hypothetical protein
MARLRSDSAGWCSGTQQPGHRVMPLPRQPLKDRLEVVRSGVEI